MNKVSLNVGCMNCRGLAETKKRLYVFNWMKRKLFDITVLVDTHSCDDSERHWLNEWGYECKFSSYSSSSRGVAILFSKHISFEIHSFKKDIDGNYIILDITVCKKRLTLAAVYGPNKDNPNFFDNLYSMIVEVGNLSIIAVGDWNVVQNYQIDTRGYKGENNKKSQAAIHDLMTKLSLVDIWRSKNPDSKRYTWRASNKNGRLDYFLISDDLIDFVSTADIHPSYRSDHSLISLSFSFPNERKGRGFWKFNSSLLKDLEYVTLVKRTIYETVQQYFVEDVSSTIKFNISDQLFFEVLKLAIRGATISYNAGKKRMNEKNQNFGS